MHEIIVATANPHKVRELEAILETLGITNARFRSLAETNAPTRPPEESGHTFEDNASIKAAAYAAQTGSLCLADDSGLEVDALAGAPGVISAHYATDGVPPDDERTGRAQRDHANNERLLRDLDGVPPELRTARFVCVMALAAPGNTTPGSNPSILATARGTFEGRIGLPGEVPRGTNGFGYDPLFLLAPEFELTSAELEPERKNTLSHRARAVEQMAAHIRDLGP